MDIDTNTDTPSVDATLNLDTSTPAIDSVLPVENVPVIEEFTPSYKYKAYGKELEMDDWAKPLLNKDNQPHLTKLFEKAGGFEPLKESYKYVEQELGSYKNAYSELDTVRNNIVGAIEKGDLATAFKALGLTSEQIRNHVRKELEYEGMPHEQKLAIDRQRQLEHSQQMYQQQLESQQSFAQDLVMQKHELEMTMLFNNPKYAPLIESYNQRAGNESAFRAAVDKIGAYEHAVNGRNIPVSDAIEQAVHMLGLNAQPVIGNNVIPMNQPNTQTNKPQPRPIVVPNGSSASPVRKRAMSVADLEKEYSQLTN